MNGWSGFFETAFKQSRNAMVLVDDRRIQVNVGLGSLQTRPFILYPRGLAPPAEPIIGAAAVHELLVGWRQGLSGGAEDDEEARTKVEQAV